MDEVYYFDNAATTFPKPDKVIEAVTEAMKNGCVNVGRGSYDMAADAARDIDRLRERILEYSGSTKCGNVVLTPSATIAFNLLLGGINLKKGSIVYVSPFEHNAVMRVLHAKQQKEEIIIRELPIDKYSLLIDMDRIEYEFSRYVPDMVCISHISNVTGYILPIREICESAKKNNEYAVTVVDGCQALGLISRPLLNNNAVDYYVFAGHKTLYGPFGIGGIICHSAYSVDIIKNRESYVPYICGGTGMDSLNMDMVQDSPEMLESGSIDIVAAKGLLAAIEIFFQEIPPKENLLKEIFLKEIFLKEKIKTEKLTEGLQEIDEVHLYIPKNRDEHISIVSFNVEGYSSQETGMILNDDYMIAVRTGYHCAPLIHNYLKDEMFNGTVRASVGRYTTDEQIRYFVNAVREIAQE
ncbi:MAG: aminotransferase class V-fold PLP-dependent enzyme [Lachnospiraceae bacterium]|nr:aminotransferase class V-fold PLP-dependent enzyme [Lachnospiraceae bacterium]